VSPDLYLSYACFALAALVIIAECAHGLLRVVAAPYSFLKAKSMSFVALLTFLTTELPLLVSKLGPLITEFEALLAEFRSVVPKPATPVVPTPPTPPAA
jgi:hypothetical protein